MLKIAQDNPYYQKAILHESLQWKEGFHDSQNFELYPQLRSYHNEQISGDPQKDWVDFVIQKFGPFKRGCCLGCGAGRIEEQFVCSNAFESCDFFDISKDAMNKLEGRLKTKTNAQLNFLKADLNFYEFTPQSYDFILAIGSLHHLVNLEHLLFQIAQALKENGIFVVRDFVGETRFQWSSEKCSLVNLMRKLWCKKLGGGVESTRKRAL